MARAGNYSLFMGSPSTTPIPAAASASTPSHPTVASASPSSYNPFDDLGRTLARLERSLLHTGPDAWRRLVADDFLRSQARFDLAVARTMLARVEPATQQIKKLTLRQSMLNELGRRGALVEQLQERLDDLDEEARALAEMHGEEEEEEDEVDSDLAHITPSRATASTSLPLETTAPATPSPLPPPSPEDTPSAQLVGAVSRKAPTTEPEPEPARSSPTSGRSARPTSVRSARPRRRRRTQADGLGQDRDRDTAHTSSSQAVSVPSTSDVYGGSATALFGSAGSADPLVSEEAALDKERREQELLHESIVEATARMKQNSLAMRAKLDEDKGVVERVGEGMDTTKDNMTAASRSMALLASMTEGKSWLQRMLAMAIVYGLMLVLVLVFLFMPKFRL